MYAECCVPFSNRFSLKSLAAFSRVIFSAAAMKRIKSMETISSPRDGKTDETTAWEATLWVPTDAADASTHPRLVIHFSNATSTGGSSVEGDLRMAVKLPPPLAAVAASRLRATV